MSSRLATIVAVTLAVAFGAAPLAASAATAPSRTSRVEVRPVDAQGHLLAGYRVGHEFGRAHCLRGGIADNQAYRCFAGNEIFDPCWVQDSATAHVICLRDPWHHTVARLRVTKGFDNGYAGGPSRSPWAIRLVSGPRCVGVQGASGAVAGHGISYVCLDGKTVLLDEPDMAHSLWTIRVARDTGGYHYRRIGRHAIAAAYFGRRSLVG